MAAYDNSFKSAFSVDNVVFGYNRDTLNVLLVQRGAAPHKSKWALPGDLVTPNEELDQAASRVLEELVGLKGVFLEQVRTFSSLNRHPLGRVITIAYYSLIKLDSVKLIASSWVDQAIWHPLQDARALKLAFDHNEILEACYEKLKRRAKTQPVGLELLPEQFTWSELQQLYEAILQVPLDKRNFRKKIQAMDLLIDLKKSQTGVAHRPAKLYCFNKERYSTVSDDGFTLEN